jgi:hypothetical protein
MSAPRDLIAQFTSTVAVDGAAAVRALLGGTPLPSATSTYLDTIGNQNGVFDVGDYLAWLARTGGQLPAALSRLANFKR